MLHEAWLWDDRGRCSGCAVVIVVMYWSCDSDVFIVVVFWVCGSVVVILVVCQGFGSAVVVVGLTI